MLPMEWMNFEGPMIAAVAGLIFAVFSALENRVTWIASLCAVFGEGCRKTADFTILRIPVSWWGIGYYVVLSALLVFAQPLVFWFVMIGLGLELTFLWTLITMRAFCIFCALNAVAVAALVFFEFDPTRIWEAATTALVFFIGSNFLLSRENRAELSAHTDSETLAAVIDGDEIRMDWLTRPLTQRIHNLKMQIYRLQRARLERLIRDILLKKEAGRRGCSKTELEKSIADDAEAVTEAEIDDFYRDNRRRYADRQPDAEDLRQEIRATLRKKKRDKKIQQFAEGLKDQYDVKIYLQEPALPLTEVNVSGGPAQGPQNADVVVVEFSDYLCPACRKAHEVVRRVRQTFNGRVRWIFKDLPLQRHKGAEKLAEAAHCADAQGKFWQYQDLLFSSNGKPDEAALDQFAAELDLDRERFQACRESREYEERVEKNAADAKEAGISATPTFLINGKMRSGAPSEEEFEQLIESELQRP